MTFFDYFYSEILPCLKLTPSSAHGSSTKNRMFKIYNYSYWLLFKLEKKKQKKIDWLIFFLCITVATEAWVTLATNDSYAIGVMVLAHSLRAVQTTRPLVVMVGDHVSSAMRFVYYYCPYIKNLSINLQSIINLNQLLNLTCCTYYRSQLSEVCCLVKEVNILDSEDSAHLALLARPELGITFTKLHCWTLTQFSKCVFLDADTLVHENQTRPDSLTIVHWHFWIISGY